MNDYYEDEFYDDYEAGDCLDCGTSLDPDGWCPICDYDDGYCPSCGMTFDDHGYCPICPYVDVWVDVEDDSVEGGVIPF